MSTVAWNSGDQKVPQVVINYDEPKAALSVELEKYKV